MLVKGLTSEELWGLADVFDRLGHSGDYKGAGPERSSQADEIINAGGFSREKLVQISVVLRAVAFSVAAHESKPFANHGPEAQSTEPKETP